MRSPPWPFAPSAARASDAGGCAPCFSAVACFVPPDAGAGVVSINGTEPQNPLVPTDTNEVGGGDIVDMLFEPGSISDEVRTCIEDALTDEVLGEAFVADPEASGDAIVDALEPCNRLT